MCTIDVQVLTLSVALACSCAEDDDTVVYCVANSEDLRTTTYQFSETVTAIAVDYTSVAYKNDGMILVGTQSGRLIKYRPSVLFGKREKRVEDGKNSPVKAIAWNDNLVAWADDEGLYLFDIATKSAIGRVPTPCGPGDRDLYPVSIRWTDTDQLLLGWAYTVTVLKVKTSVEEGLLTEAGNLVLKVVHSWETDCVVAGIHAFDRDHILYLGYSTISADEMGYSEEAENAAIEEGDENEDADVDQVPTPADTTTGGATRSPGATADLEVIVAKIGDGEIVSADVLPLQGNLYLSQGPFQFQLLSSYDTRTLLRDPPHRQWQLHHYNEVRGGDQGKAPLLFISSPEDIVIGRVRDVNDRVRAALGHGDLKLAVEVAQYDRASLRVYGYAELLEGYIAQLLNSNEPAMAAKEIGRLAGMDAILWETWVYRFIKMGLLDYLCLEIPTQKPRLERNLYEEVLDQLITKHPEKLVPTLQTWSAKGPTTTGDGRAGGVGGGLYDREALIQRLEKQLRLARRIAMAPVDVPLDAADDLAASYEEPSLLSSSAAPTSREDGILSSYQHTQEAKWRRQRRRETRHAARHYFAALAHLHLLNKNYEKALNCYLHRLSRSNNAAATGTASVAVPNVVGSNVGKAAASSVSSSSGKAGSLLGNNNVAVSSSIGSGRTTSQARRETSVSTMQASEAARQVQQDVGAGGDTDDVDFDLESDDDDVDEGLIEGGEAHVGGISPVRERRKALDESLQSNAAGGGGGPSSSSGSGGPGHSSGNGNGNSISEHRHVFELIEKENLFHSIAGKIRYLVRLSRPLCQRLLLSHLDKLPIGSVAAQLQSDRDLLRWYLTALFADVSARETYRAKEFSNLHLKQLQLSIEHRARTVLQQYQWQAQQGLTASSPWSAVYAAATASSSTAALSSSSAAAAGSSSSAATTLADASDLLTFLKAGWIPATVALQEIDQFTASATMMDLLATYNPNNHNNQPHHVHASFSLPPVEPLAPHQLLCEERVYLLAMQGEKLAALRLLLETDDVDRVLSFLTVHGHGHAARYFQPSATATSSSSSSMMGYHHHTYDDDNRAIARDPNSYELQREGQQLWEEVVRRGLESPSFLQVLVTRLGDAGMDGTLLLRRLSEHVEHIPQFRQKMTGVVLDLHTMETLNRTCRALQQDEALALLGQKNRRQRRAIKIEARSSTMQRCTICLRPLGTEASPPTLDQAMLLLSKGGAMELQLPCAPSEISICGTHAAAAASAAAMAASSTSSSSSSSAAGGGHHHHHPHAVHPLLFFNAKNAVHHSCFNAIVRAEGESRRVAEESKELIGGVASSVMEKRGMVARTHHTQVHR